MLTLNSHVNIPVIDFLGLGLGVFEYDNYNKNKLPLLVQYFR